jgi:hypothetical protein
MKLNSDDIERIHITRSDVEPFKVWMDKELVYQKNGKLYQDYADEETGEEETIEVKLSDLYDKFKKRKSRRSMKLKEIYTDLSREKKIVSEGEAKLSKGNKSTKNVFGDEKVETSWATGDRKCCEDYGITCEDAEKKIKDIKSIDKLDEEYQRLFLQMDNEMDRYWFRRSYQEIRNKIGKKEMPKPTKTNTNF